MIAADSVPYLYTVDRLTKYAIGVRLNSKSAAQLLVGLRKALGIWRGFDREPAGNAISAELWSEEHVLACCERYGCSAFPRIAVEGNLLRLHHAPELPS
jgi:hypothetical protein